MKYLVIRIGCLCCGEPTKIVGAFDNEVQANRIMRKANKAESKKEEGWTAEYCWGVFEVKDV